MILYSFRFLFFLVIVAASTLIGTTGFTADGGYGENRLRADTDPRTVQARRHFNTETSKIFSAAKKKYRVQDVELDLDQRLMGQYGRGQKSANDVLPKELDQILNFISQARYKKAALVKQMIGLKSLSAYKRKDIEKAVTALAQIKKIKLSYWGYLSKKELLPEYKESRHRLTYFAEWHEAKSYYQLHTEAQVKSLIIRGLISELNAPKWGAF